MNSNFFVYVYTYSFTRQWHLLNAGEYAKENRARCLYTPYEEVRNSTKKFASFLALYTCGTLFEN